MDQGSHGPKGTGQTTRTRSKAQIKSKEEKTEMMALR